MKTVEIDEEVLEAMFTNVEYLHRLVKSVLRLLTVKGLDDWLTTKEAAGILRISVSTLNNLRMYGKIPFTQIEGRPMFLAKDLARYLLSVKVDK